MSWVDRRREEEEEAAGKWQDPQDRRGEVMGGVLSNYSLGTHEMLG